ncbi:portal protein [uncultured Brevundimonas sp.]|uniref:portal protein n=1 Tax=uncultured Brevundimonas sp. TaxID=213418 RepID=UPI00263321F8|nr:portal protein [uncultured Brevundimonas sp.]
MADDIDDERDDVEDPILAGALRDFERAMDHDRDNREAFSDDIAFARLGEQWDEGLKAKRTKEGRPCLTINKLPPFIRQVVNDARQNKPSIKVLPQDSEADPDTAEIYTGLIRNIEASSDADVAWDTALDNAASGGFGFFRINLAYAHDETFDQDIVFERIIDPLTVLGDPDSESADGSDWNVAFVTRLYTRRQFKAEFPDAEPVDFEAQEYPDNWSEGDRIQVAEYWVRESVERQIVLLSSGKVIGLKEYEANAQSFLEQGIEIEGQPRTVLGYKVTQHIVTGVEVLRSTEWPGQFIPIVPVYGEEVVHKGKRHWRSLIRDAKDAQVMYNAWRTSSTELVALAPKVPFIGPKGAFDTDQAKWDTANSVSHSFIEYDGHVPPQRQQLGAPAAGGALQEALNASDDMKSIIGIYDAGIGARSNETSGRAIMARQRESDTSTFHFIDNLSRAIRHAGRILIDLIPKVYSAGRVIRILGEDGVPDTVQLGSPEEVQAARMQAAAQQNAEIAMIYDLGLGRYDLTVTVGPSFNTRREEAATQMMEAAQAFPGLMEVAGDIIARNLDWPGADEIAERLTNAMQGQQQGQQPAQAQEPQVDPAKIAQVSLDREQMMIDARQQEQKLSIDAFNAQTNRLKAAHQIQQPTRLPRMPGSLG